MTATGSELCPISEAVSGAQAATTTYQGNTVVRVGVRQRTRSMTCLVSVKAGIATILPVSGTLSTTYLDIGQLVDGTGAPTGTYVSWQSPGQAWSRSRVSSGATYRYGTDATPLDIITVSNQDYGVNLATGQVVDLSATAQSPGVAANVRTFTPPTTDSNAVSCCLQHLGALVYVAASGSYMSTDGGRTWPKIAVSGSPAAAGQSLGNGPYSVGTPLFQY